MSYDYLIVGAGFTGATCARQLAEQGKRVLIIDKRDHIGGNAYDYLNQDGVRIHKYGPHLFHTNSDKVWDFLSRFTEWTPYEHRVRAVIRGEEATLPFPINLTTLEMVFKRTFTAHEAMEFIADRVAHDWHGGEIRTAEDQCIASVGCELYELFFKGYSTKMWGVDPSQLDKSVTARIPFRLNRDDRYFTDKHQALPKDGYTALFERMLDHENITVTLGTSSYGSAYRIPSAAPTMDIIWTGPIDQYFGQCYGPLPYRSMKFDLQAWETLPPTYTAPAATVNFPEPDIQFTRATEWARLMGEPKPISVLTYELPCAEGEPFYPIPSDASRALYKRYEALADAEPNVTFLGRLGTYQYLNMDQACAQALMHTERLQNAA